MKKKTLMLFITFSMVVVVLVGCLSAYASDNTKDEAKDLEEFVDIQCEAAELNASIDDNSILPETFAAVESHKLIDGDNNANESACEDIISREATYWYAVNNGFGISADELSNRLNLLVSEIKEAEEYSVVEELYNANGTSFEENIFDNYRFYETEFVISDMYDYYQASYEDGNTEFKGVKYESWDSYWEAVEKNAYLEYAGTNDYNMMNKAVNEAINVIDDEELLACVSEDNSKEEVAEVIEGTSIYDKLSYERNEIGGDRS